MKKVTYEIKLKDGSTKSVEGYRYNEIFHIKKKCKKYWEIDHMPTGLRLGPLVTTRKKAVENLERMLQATEGFDWDFNKNQVTEENRDWLRKAKDAVFNG